MSGEERDHRDKAHEKLSKYWEWRPGPEGVGGEIRTRDSVPSYKLWWRWFHKFTMKEFWWWGMREWDTPQAMSFDHWMDHGNIKIDPALEKKVSHTFQMRKDWRIRESDLAYLRGSTLLDEEGQRILVRPYGYFASIVIKLEPYGALISVVGVILAIIFGLRAW